MMLGYQDLSARWNVPEGTIRQWRYRNLLPEPDKMIGVSPTWTEETIRQWEDTSGRVGTGRS